MERCEYLHADLTEKLIGFAFDIFKQVGPRYPEKIYQKAFENKLRDNQIKYSRENYGKVVVDGRKVGGFYLDFVVDNRVVVELKVREKIISTDVAQVLTYMKLEHMKIGIILLFTLYGVKIKRLII